MAEWMFAFGTQPAAADVAPLACVAGGLIVDSGEEDLSFVFRCQDRYPVYTALAGLRSLFFVLDDAHVDVYEERLRDLARRLDLVTAKTGVLESLTVPSPLYVGYDPMTGTVAAVRSTVKALADDAVAASVRAGLRCNQVSPTYAALIAGVSRVCADHGVPAPWDADEIAAQGERCARAYDKAHYVELLAGRHEPGIAPHVATSVHPPEVVFASRSWEDLCALLPEGTPARRVHIKSTMDSGGNVAAGLGPDDAAAGLDALRREWADGALDDDDARRRAVDLTRRKIHDNWILGRLGRRHDLVELLVEAKAKQRALHPLRLLVQPRVESPAASPPASVGCSFAIEAADAVSPIAVAQQVFVDRDRRKHLGAALSTAVEAAFAMTAGPEEFAALCRVYAADGYRGPISFDAVLDERGRYVGIYDCNPRLTAVFPPLAVQRALQAEGAPCDSIVNLDYRGLHTWPDAAGRLDVLDEAGLLYTRQRGRGVLPLPNLARPDSFDLHMVGVSPSEVGGLLEHEALGSGVDIDKGAVAEVFT